VTTDSGRLIRSAVGSGWYLLRGLGTGLLCLLGAPLLSRPAAARRWADRHREQAGLLLGRPITGPMGTRRALLWLPIQATAGLGLGLLALLVVGNAITAVIAMGFWWLLAPGNPPHLFMEVPVTDPVTALTLGPVQLFALILVALFGFPPLARMHARGCLAVLTPSAAERLADRVTVLTASRADVLDAHGAELRRIERDLHDGTQAQLVAIAVRLGIAEQAHEQGNHELVGQLLGQAHAGTEAAMTGLRSVLRSVYPPILSDRGLVGALTAVTADCAVPGRLEIGDLGRVPATVEAAVYFSVAEALTNVARHSRATAAEVWIGIEAGRLIATVTDDGEGGAQARPGSGLNGIRDRIGALDGTLTIISPVGGPTTIRLELPCEW
jgi:signal transduction histidine kinase